MYTRFIEYRRLRLMVIFVIVSMLLSGCATGTAESPLLTPSVIPPTLTMAPTNTLPPTEMPAPTPSPTLIPPTTPAPTPSPTSIPPTLEGTQIVSLTNGLPALERITVENADRVQQLASLSIPGYILSKWHQCNTAFSPDGRYLVGACGKSRVPVWKIETLALHTTLYDTAKAVVSCEFDPDSQVLACAGFQHREVTLWSVETGEQIERFPCNSTVFEVDFSPDGHRLVAASAFSISMDTGKEVAGAVHLWDLSTGELLWENETMTPRSFLTVSYHPSGETVAFGKERGGAGIMNALTGELLLYFDTDGRANIGDLTYSPSGQLLALGKDDYNVYVYETTDYHLMATLEHQHYVNGVVFSADETLLISGSGENDRALRIWAIDNFRLLNQLSGHTDSILRIDINSAGTLIASISWDGTVRLWGIPVGSP